MVESMIERIPYHSCWEWSGSIDPAYGYGRLSFGGRQWRAHRWVYEKLRGPIPAGLTLDHLCRNRTCVNPDHLEPVTNKVNVLRGVGITARRARQTDCVHGHPFDSANTHLGQHGERICRICRREGHLRRRMAAQRRKALANGADAPRSRCHGSVIYYSGPFAYCQTCRSQLKQGWPIADQSPKEPKE